MTLEEAAKRHGEGNYELIEDGAPSRPRPRQRGAFAEYSGVSSRGELK